MLISLTLCYYQNMYDDNTYEPYFWVGTIENPSQYGPYYDSIAAEGACEDLREKGEKVFVSMG